MDLCATVCVRTCLCCLYKYRVDEMKKKKIRQIERVNYQDAVSSHQIIQNKKKTKNNHTERTTETQTHNVRRYMR